MIPCDSWLNRRHLLLVALGLSIARPTSAQEAEVPHFASGRYQFIIIRPALRLPETILFPLDGPARRLTDFAGTPILLNFWATWCPACRQELPILNHLQAEYGPKRLRVIAVSEDSADRRVVRRYVESLKLDQITIFFDPNGYAASHDPNNPRNAPFLLYGMPITYAIAASGWIVGYIPGQVDWTSPEAKNLISFLARS